MSPAAWRKREKLPLRAVARRLGIKSRETVRRYETGEHEAPTSIALAYERISGGDVTGEDLNRVRRRFLRESGNKAAA